MSFIKRHLAPLAAGLVVLAGVSYVMAAEVSSPPSDEVALAQGSTEGPGSSDEAPPDGRPRGRGHHRPGLPKAVRGELVVPARQGDGFDTVRFDRGVLDRVDGATLVITEDDGTTVEIPTTDETRIGRDGKSATVEDLEPGDHVAAFRVKDGDAFVTKGVRAVSPERWEQFLERRDGMRNGSRPRGPGATEPAGQ